MFHISIVDKARNSLLRHLCALVQSVWLKRLWPQFTHKLYSFLVPTLHTLNGVWQRPFLTFTAWCWQYINIHFLPHSSLDAIPKQDAIKWNCQGNTEVDVGVNTDDNPLLWREIMELNDLPDNKTYHMFDARKITTEFGVIYLATF